MEDLKFFDRFNILLSEKTLNGGWQIMYVYLNIMTILAAKVNNN